MVEAYKPYLDYILAGGVAETAYLLSREGAICTTNLPITVLPTYNFALEDEKDPNVKHNVVVDERVNLLANIANNGVPKSAVGYRLYNQKYYFVRANNLKINKEEYDPKSPEVFYLKKEHGGAAIALTKNYIVIGTFNIQLNLSNGVPQNPGELNKRIESLAKGLILKGA